MKKKKFNGTFYRTNKYGQWVCWLKMIIVYTWYFSLNLFLFFIYIRETILTFRNNCVYLCVCVFVLLF